MNQHANIKQSDAALNEFLGIKPLRRRTIVLRWGAAAIAVLAVLWTIYGWMSSADIGPRYATASIERGSLRVTVSATGNLQPTNKVDVGSELSGTITEVHVDNNDRVTRGQLLARLDTSRLEDAVNQSKAALEAAEASVAQAEANITKLSANLNRLEEVFRLSNGRVPAATELDTARAEHKNALATVRSAQASVAQARAQLSSNETSLSKAIIRSPVTGIVLSRQIEPGQTVAASLNAPVLFVIAEDLAQMQLEVKVDEADVGQVNAGQNATFQVDAFPGRRFPATVKRIDVGANAGTSSSSSSSSTSSTSTSGQVVSYMAILTVSNPDLILRQGMTATAEIVTAEHQDVLLVPDAALRFVPPAASTAERTGGIASMLMPRPRRASGTEREVSIGRGSEQMIYVLGDDGTPTAKSVTVGDSDGRLTEVSGSGLSAGLPVITGQLASAAR